MSTYVIGLDLGGTFIKGVVLDDQAKGPLVSVQTDAGQGPDAVIQRLQEAAQMACTEHGIGMDQVLGIGVGAPGPLHIEQGLILKSANLPGWERVALRDRLASLTGRPVSLTNDANAAAFGEFRHGAGQGTTNMAMLTLGTGVGGGIILGGELLHGHFDNAGELGHLIVMPGQGGQCACGQDGCLEAFASGAHLRARARELGAPPDVDVPDIIAAAEAGDSAMGQLWEHCCQAIAIGCVNIQHMFNPQRLILGGGMTAAGDALLGPVRRAFRAATWKLVKDYPEIRLAALGNRAGAVGAAEWFLHVHHRERLNRRLSS